MIYRYVLLYIFLHNISYTLNFFPTKAFYTEDEVYVAFFFIFQSASQFWDLETDSVTPYAFSDSEKLFIYFFLINFVMAHPAAMLLEFFYFFPRRNTSRCS